MKQKIKLLLLAIIIFSLKLDTAISQITYEHTYALPHVEENFRIINLGNNNYKYAIINYHDSNFSLYNLDHTPFMLNISVPLLDDTSGTEISYITSSLFDCDSNNIEYVLTNFVVPLRLAKFYIFRTDGTLLFFKDSVTMPYCTGCGAGGAEVKGINNTSTGTKLFLFNDKNQYFIYGLAVYCLIM
jgi:hypothetical protein